MVRFSLQAVGLPFILELQIRGTNILVEADTEDAIRYLRDTFYPDGCFSAKLISAATPDIILRDRTVPSGELNRIWGESGLQGSRAQFEITKGVFREKIAVGRRELFSLSDLNGAQSSLLIRDGNIFELLGAPDRHRKRWLTRLVRDIGTRLALTEDSLILHASAFELDKKAFVVIGDSGAGKTTLSLAMARLLKGTAWIGNDRIHVDRATGGAMAVTACPLSLAANKGTLEILGYSNYREWDLYDEVPDDLTDWGGYNGEVKLKISPGEVERYLQVTVSAGAPLGGVILPSIQFGGKSGIERASASQAIAVIQRNCLSLSDNMYGQDWLRLQTRDDNALANLEAFIGMIKGLPVLSFVTTNPADLEPQVRSLESRLRENAS